MTNHDRELIHLQMPPWPKMTAASYRYFLQNEKHITRICDHYVLIFMLDRSLLFIEDNKEIILNKGEWYVQRPGLLQQGKTGSPAPSYFYIHFIAQEVDSMDQLIQNSYPGEVNSNVFLYKRGSFDPRYLKPFLDQLDYCNKTKPYDILGIQSIFLTILNNITTWPQVAPGQELGNEITRFLIENYNKDISCDILAKKFNFSTEYINRKIKQYSGMTPVQFLQHQRITRAMDLLANTDHTLIYIAVEVGYHDSTVFYKAFHKLTGMSPGEWRKNSRKIN